MNADLKKRVLAEFPRTAAVLARLAAARLADAGIDPKPLLRKAGIRDTLSAADVQVNVRHQIVFLNLASDALGDELLGFHLALECDLRDVGLLYYVMSSSPTLGEAVALASRYSWMVNEGLHLVYRSTSSVTIEFKYVGVERHLDRHQIEFWVTCVLRKFRLFTGRELVPTHVGFVHRYNGDVSEMQRYFGCPLAFGAIEDRISFELQAAQLSLVTADPFLNRYLREIYEDAIARRPRNRTRLRTQVENAITPRLPHGTSSLRNIASDLGMSPRTLSRRLAEEGENFRVIIEELRSDIGTRYLQDKNLSITQIGWMLGYTEASTFVRAVRRWTGKPPREFRRQITKPGKRA